MSEVFSRNELFWGKDSQKLLAEKKVAVIGLGGVGGICAEMLARAGVGEMLIADFDNVSGSNINRQLIALHSTVGQKKSKLWKDRLVDINPNLKLTVKDEFCQYFDNLKSYDYVCDAIDTMRSKISLLEFCYNEKINIISSFGAGNRVDPTKLYLCDISEIKEKNAPFISSILYQLKKRDITSGIKVVTSSEKPQCLEKIISKEEILTKEGEKIEFQKITPASTPFVASTSGIIMASCVVSDLTSSNNKNNLKNKNNKN